MIIDRIKRLLNRTAIKFVLTGILNTAVGLGSIFLLKWLLDMPDTRANLFGYCIGFTVSCFVNARWTFEYKQALWAVAPKYAALVVFAYLVNLATVHVAIGILEINSYLSQALGVVPYALITYFGAKHVVFVARPGRIEHVKTVGN